LYTSFIDIVLYVNTLKMRNGKAYHFIIPKGQIDTIRLKVEGIGGCSLYVLCYMYINPSGVELQFQDVFYPERSSVISGAS